jgi:hypothetical protein
MSEKCSCESWRISDFGYRIDPSMFQPFALLACSATPCIRRVAVFSSLGEARSHQKHEHRDPHICRILAIFKPAKGFELHSVLI